MASYHFAVQILKRSDGKSAVAASAYRSGTLLIDERENKICDYSRRGGVVYSEIILPKGADFQLADRANLWNLVEAVEVRKDAQLAREINLALPHELTESQRLELLREFVGVQFVKLGMVADVAVHAPQEVKGDHQKNHHAHVMLSLRQATPHGLARVKTREWNTNDLVHHWRKEWADIQNKYLERHGHEARVDHRTLTEQRADAMARGDTKAAVLLDRDPEINVGKHDWHNKQGRYLRNLEIINRNHERTHDLALSLRAYTAEQKQNKRIAATKAGGHNIFDKEAAKIFETWAGLKNVYGSLPGKDRPDEYWHTLNQLLDVMTKLYPGQNISKLEELTSLPPLPDEFEPAAHDLQQDLQHLQLARPRTPYDDLLDEIFKQHAPHLSFFEKIQLALAYADIAQNAQAGRVGFVKKSMLHQQTGKILKQAYGRRRDKAMRRYRGRRPPNKKR